MYDWTRKYNGNKITWNERESRSLGKILLKRNMQSGRKNCDVHEHWGIADDNCQTSKVERVLGVWRTDWQDNRGRSKEVLRVNAGNDWRKYPTLIVEWSRKIQHMDHHIGASLVEQEIHTLETDVDRYST